MTASEAMHWLVVGSLIIAGSFIVAAAWGTI